MSIFGKISFWFLAASSLIVIGYYIFYFLIPFITHYSVSKETRLIGKNIFIISSAIILIDITLWILFLCKVISYDSVLFFNFIALIPMFLANQFGIINNKYFVMGNKKFEFKDIEKIEVYDNKFYDNILITFKNGKSQRLKFGKKIRNKILEKFQSLTEFQDNKVIS